MFTGIIQHVGRIERVESTPAGRRLWIELGPFAEGLRLGDSIAVNGACLTAARIDAASAGFDAVAETLGRTTLGQLAAGDRANLEPAMRLGDRLDGHLVQGHVDGLGRVDRVDKSGGQWLIHVACEAGLTDQMVAKGSVAIDGVSLTVVDVQRGKFHVTIIPTTLDKTALADRRVGDRVNLETDVIGKYVQRYLGRFAPGQGSLTIEKLRGAGF